MFGALARVAQPPRTRCLTPATRLSGHEAGRSFSVRRTDRRRGIVISDGFRRLRPRRGLPVVPRLTGSIIGVVTRGWIRRSGRRRRKSSYCGVQLSSRRAGWRFCVFFAFALCASFLRTRCITTFSSPVAFLVYSSDLKAGGSVAEALRISLNQSISVSRACSSEVYNRTEPNMGQEKCAEPATNYASVEQDDGMLPSANRENRQEDRPVVRHGLELGRR